MRVIEIKKEGDITITVYAPAPIKKAQTVKAKVSTAYSRKDIARIQTLAEVNHETD